jgi:hypothetical protein
MTGATDGSLYASSTDISTSNLYRINPATGTATLIGEITNAPAIIDIAINAQGEMYGVEIVNDVLVEINPATAAGTVVGPLGVAANYAQGMDFEELSGILYWASYSTSGELRIIDTDSGASAPVGAFPGGAEVDCLAFPTGGVGADVPWLSEDPVSGVVPADSYLDVGITFTALPTMTAGTYTATLIVDSDDAVNGMIYVPVTMTILAAPVCGFESSSPDWWGETTVFTNTTVGAEPISYQWDLGDGTTSTEISPTHLYDLGGTYTVILTATNYLSTDVCTGTVEIDDSVICNFESSSPDVWGETTVFTNTSYGGGSLTYDWAFGDGMTSTVPSPTHSYAMYGTYTVTLTATNGVNTEACIDLVLIEAEHIYLPVLLLRH